MSTRRKVDSGKHSEMAPVKCLICGKMFVPPPYGFSAKNCPECKRKIPAKKRAKLNDPYSPKVPTKKKMPTYMESLDIKTIAALAKKHGISYGEAVTRLSAGWRPRIERRQK